MDKPGSDVFRRHAELAAENRRLLEEADRLCAEVKRQITSLERVQHALHCQWQPGFLRPLQDAIRAMHGCESLHLASYAVGEGGDAQKAPVRIVEEFMLVGADRAKNCYAWQFEEGGQTRTFTLLKEPPVDSPQAAVQFFLLTRSAGSGADPAD